jgi:malate dehydrogenase
VWLTGQYGLDGLFMGAPARLGRNGVEDIVEVSLTPGERELLDKSAGHVRSSLADLERIQKASPATA